MSLFSVLKYHISFPPTAEELAALPPDIYRLWAAQTFGPWSITPPEAVKTLHRLLSAEMVYTEDFRTAEKAIARLKYTIREMDE